jgi:hypothetical protein
MNLVVSLVAVILGVFITAFPSQAARIWGSDELKKLAPARKIVFLRWWQVFGILLCLGGILSAVDSFGFLNFYR